MRRLLVLLIASLTLFVAACGDNESTSGGGGSTGETETAETQPAETTEEAETASGCRAVDEPKPKSDKPGKPKERLARDKTWTAVMKTSCGTVEIRLDVKDNPKTASSFASLARAGFYDDLSFHRIVPGFVVQGGDPKGTGEGGPGYSVVEAPPRDQEYTKGVVAMAKTELEKPGTSGSQFFIVTGEDAGLPPDYAVVGEVSKGMDVVDLLAEVPNDPADNKPTEPVVIEEVTIREGS
jgi:peptidyl-prolyl cis-trans isomerase B (cyclophilin B)